MKMTTLLAAGVLLLSACASSGTRDGLVYRDGSWYSPAGDGRGDYYTAMPYGDAWDHPYHFGIGITRYGGYCPVRYRYCTSFWADPFFGPYFGAYYDPFYNPYWYQPWIYYRPHPHPHPHRRPPTDRHDPRPDSMVVLPPPERRERPTPRPWDERPASRFRDRDEGEPRPRRRPPVVNDGKE